MADADESLPAGRLPLGHATPASGASPAAITEARVAGEVQAQVFASEDRAHVVLRVTDREGVERTLVGALDAIHPGQELEAWGRWEQHPVHGPRLKVARFTVLPPSNPAGITRYLASGVVPGVGPKLAERVVAKFGKDTLWVIANASQRLLEVPGFGKHRLQQVRATWTAQDLRRDAQVFLQGLGLSPRMAERLYQKYEGETISAVRANPYRLAEDIRGIGFTTADQVAAQLKISPESPFRLTAGAAHVLRELSEDRGHVCVPRALLEHACAQLLGVTEALATDGVNRAIEAGHALAEPDREHPGKIWLFPPALHRAESQLASMVQALLAPRLTAPPVTPPAVPELAMLNATQRQAVAQAFQSGLSIITGGPGVGKTTTTKAIVASARALGWHLALAAPTGRAARRLSEATGANAATIHRLLRLDMATGEFHYGHETPLPVELLIVDEASMLELRLASQLFAAIGPGTRVVLVGDQDQLPSVGPGSVLRDLIRAGTVPVTALTEIYRQAAGSAIIRGAHAVNRGHLPPLMAPADGALSDFYWIEQGEPEKVQELIGRMVSERIPKRFGLDPMEDIQVLSPMNRGIGGARALNSHLQALLNPPSPERAELPLGDLVLRVGDRVMQVVNNYELHVFNGEMGRVSAILASERRFMVRFDAGELTYPFEEADQLRLAYAVTVHKAQGCEFPAVIVPMLTQHFVMLRRTLLYTAMTRASRLLVLVGSRRALELAVRNASEQPRFTRLVERLRAGPL